MKTIRLYLTILLTLVVSISTSAATYRLQKVTAVKAGGLYVFEQDGYVMSSSVIGSELQTENEYLTSGLMGTESYVWKLEKGKDNAFKMRNMSLSSNQFLCYTGSSTNLKFGSSSAATSWTFTFQENETFLIQVKNNEKRFLGFKDDRSHVYKAYLPGNTMEQYPHSINVFELVEDIEIPTAIRSVSDTSFSSQGKIAYNLAGQRVGAGYRGLVIVDGKAVLKR